MRVFVALDLPEELKEEIVALAQKLARKIPLRLVAKKNLHLTLVFLGEQEPERLERIKKGISRAVASFSQFNLVLENLALFPDQKRPRGLWLDVRGQKEKYFSLYKKIVDGLLKEGLVLRKKNFDFSPHCTIGRFPEKEKMPGNLSKKIAKYNLDRQFLAQKVILYESELSFAGATYFKLQEYVLR